MPPWSWVALPVAIDVENRTVMSFLRWVARETGCKLQFDDDQARASAEGTILHGSVSHLSIGTALQAVLATTSLRAEIGDGAIFVRGGADEASPRI